MLKQRQVFTKMLPLKEPSPITAITLPSSPFKSLALARPQARLIEVEV